MATRERQQVKGWRLHLYLFVLYAVIFFIFHISFSISLFIYLSIYLSLFISYITHSNPHKKTKINDKTSHTQEEWVPIMGALLKEGEWKWERKKRIIISQWSACVERWVCGGSWWDGCLSLPLRAALYQTTSTKIVGQTPHVLSYALKPCIKHGGEKNITQHHHLPTWLPSTELYRKAGWWSDPEKREH